MASGLDRPAWGSCTREAEPIKINPIIIIVIIISITIIIISVIIFIIIVLGITRKWSKIGSKIDPKMVQNRLQNDPKMDPTEKTKKRQNFEVQNGPQNAPQMGPRRPKTPEAAPRRPQDATKMAATFFWKAPGGVLEASWGVSSASRTRFDAFQKSVKNNRFYSVFGHPGAKEDVFGTSCGRLGTCWGSLEALLGAAKGVREMKRATT